MFLRKKMLFKYVTKFFYGLSYDITIEIDFWLETAKTCRLFLDERINYLITIVKRLSE